MARLGGWLGLCESGLLRMADELIGSVSTSPREGSDDPLAVGSRRGIGPLSMHSDKIWHGNSAPCASCAQLNTREAQHCTHCGQNLGQDMLQKMARHSGTWFVFDTVHPFPGVSLERMLSLIKRGALKATSIVRGPTTFYQWRFAIETPLIARHLGRCWSCHAEVAPADQDCPQCEVLLDGRSDVEQEHLPPPISSIQTAAGDASIELGELSRALTASGVEVNLTRLAHKVERPLGKIPLIFMGIAIVVVMLIVALLSSDHDQDQPDSASVQPTPGISCLTPSPSNGMSRA